MSSLDKVWLHLITQDHLFLLVHVVIVGDDLTSGSPSCIKHVRVAYS